MAKQSNAAVTELKPSWITQIKDFYQEVMAEMSKVTWPTKDELKSSTSVVVLLLAVISAIIWFYDQVFQYTIILLYKLI